MRRGLLIVLPLLLCAGDAAGKGWSRPAGGPSRSGGPEVIFTFDDGPHAKYTDMVLDALSERGVKAVFYWVGRRVQKGRARHERRVSLVERAIRDGHLVATHTIHHVHLCSVPLEEARREIDGARNLYRRLTGLPMLLFRAPYGDRCERLLRMMKERRLHHLHWDIDPREWELHDSSETARHVIRRLRRLKGRAVVLLHDTKLTTAKALPKILDWIEEENARRRERDRKPIRILSGSDLVAEHHDLRLADWLTDVTEQAGAHLRGSLGRLVPGQRLGALTRR